MTFKLNNRIARGSGVYKCDCCGKMTRDTGRGESLGTCYESAAVHHGVCYSCYEEGGFENEHADNNGQHHFTDAKGEQYTEKSPEYCPLCREEQATGIEFIMFISDDKDEYYDGSTWKVLKEVKN